jgi:ADP-ribose pyrophosphatase YjhB (NUDIX family)
VEVLLVTSRETRRWIIPKGWPWPDHEDHHSAAGEAREEAGIVGRIEEASFGRYRYVKTKESGEGVELKVEVYLLWVKRLLKDWPEREERERAWFTPKEAAKRVQERQLKELLLAVADLPKKR